MVSTPYNTPLIMGDRHKNFEDPMPTRRDIKRTNYHPVGFYLITHYLIVRSNTSVWPCTAILLYSPVCVMAPLPQLIYSIVSWDSAVVFCPLQASHTETYRSAYNIQASSYLPFILSNEQYISQCSFNMI